MVIPSEGHLALDLFFCTCFLLLLACSGMLRTMHWPGKITEWKKFDRFQLSTKQKEPYKRLMQHPWNDILCALAPLKELNCQRQNIKTYMRRCRILTFVASSTYCVKIWDSLWICGSLELPTRQIFVRHLQSRSTEPDSSRQHVCLCSYGKLLIAYIIPPKSEMNHWNSFHLRNTYSNVVPRGIVCRKDSGGRFQQHVYRTDIPSWTD